MSDLSHQNQQPTNNKGDNLLFKHTDILGTGKHTQYRHNNLRLDERLKSWRCRTLHRGHNSVLLDSIPYA